MLPAAMRHAPPRSPGSFQVTPAKQRDNIIIDSLTALQSAHMPAQKAQEDCMAACITNCLNLMQHPRCSRLINSSTHLNLGHIWRFLQCLLHPACAPSTHHPSHFDFQLNHVISSCGGMVKEVGNSSVMCADPTCISQETMHQQLSVQIVCISVPGRAW